MILYDHRLCKAIYVKYFGAGIAVVRDRTISGGSVRRSRILYSTFYLLDFAHGCARMSEIRLNRYLAQCGVGSRRQCDRLIAGGRIRVDGEVVDVLGTRIDSNSAIVELDGKSVTQAGQLRYYAYHKSRGTVVTARDPQGRETVYDALRKYDFAVDDLRYVGRLDRNSGGLLLLTNDGDLIHALTHPRFGVKKVYHVRVDRMIRDEDAERMAGEGIVSQGQVLHVGVVRALDKSETGEHWYEIVLYEGKNRQIRRMLGELGYDVLRLRRVQFGNVKLGRLKRGGIRELSDREIGGLRRKGYRVRSSGK